MLKPAQATAGGELAGCGKLGYTVRMQLWVTN